MNSEHHHIRTEQLLRSLLKSQALIERRAMAGDWPAFPRGDRRKRPLFWVNSADVESLLKDGLLMVSAKGVGLSPKTKRRLQFGHSARKLVEKTEYIPSGVERPVRRNVRGNVILRLARRTDRKGEPILTDSQITAAQRYLEDMLSAGEGHVSTLDLAAPKVDGSRCHDAAERAILSRLDGSQSLKAARLALGPDLARLVTAVCGASERLEAIERAEKWSKGTGLPVLKIALDLLARHYGTTPGVSPAETRDDCNLRKISR